MCLFLKRFIAALAFLASAGCSEGEGGEATTGGPDAADPLDEEDAAPPDPVPVDAAPPDPVPVAPPLPIEALPVGQWAVLTEHAWELAPGQEGYWCKRVEVAEDIWVRGLRASGAEGTHHVTIGTDNGQPGAFRCTGFSIGNNLLFGTGAGGGEQLFPEGVALKLEAGQALLLNLHLYNTGTEPLSQVSVVEALAIDAADVANEAALVLAGSMAFEIPPGEVTVSGGCAVSADTTLLAVGPHMHTAGIHQRVVIEDPTGNLTVLRDAPYDFEDQSYRPLDPPVVVPAGGRVLVDCTYLNETAYTLGFGESTNDEMCFAGLFHYPRMAARTTCTL